MGEVLPTRITTDSPEFLKLCEELGIEEYSDMALAILQVINGTSSALESFEELAKPARLWRAEPFLLARDERIEWRSAARAAELKAHARAGTYRKRMIAEKARQSARRKKRKRFDAW